MNLAAFFANAGHLFPYALLLLVYLFLAFQSEVLSNRMFAVPALGFLLLFAGLRGAMTPDLERYRLLYESIGASNHVLIEPSFVLISKILNSLGLDYHALFFVYTLITLVFIYCGIRNYTEQIKLSLLLYVLLPACFLNMFVEMREVSAVAIAFYATSVLKQPPSRSRTIRFIAFAALSVCFHYSAAVYWIIFLLSRRFLARPYPSAVYFFFLVCSLLVPTSVLIALLHATIYPFMPARYQTYMNMFVNIETSLAESGQLLKSLIYTFMAVCFVLFRASREDKDADHVALNLFVMGVVILNLTRAFADVTRLAYFFLVYQIVIIPAILARVKDRIGKLLATYSVVVFYLAQFLWGLFYYSEEVGSYVFLHYRNALISVLR